MLLPFMPVAVGELLADTGSLDTEEFGAYVLILIHLWVASGELPNDDEVLRKCARLTKRKWKKIKPRIAGFLVETGNPFGSRVTNRRLLREFERALQKSTQAAINGRRGGQTTAARTSKMEIANALAALHRRQYRRQGSAASDLEPNGSPLIQKEKERRLAAEEGAPPAATSEVPNQGQGDGHHLIELLDRRHQQRNRR